STCAERTGAGRHGRGVNAAMPPAMSTPAVDTVGPHSAHALDAGHPTARVLIVIPTLNEERHVGEVLDAIAGFAERAGGLIVVADGGSQDATRAIVRRKAMADPRIRLLDNPRRLQAAAVNLAVEQFGDGVDWILRLDAHSAYPDDFGD